MQAMQLHLEDRWAVLAALRADYGGTVSFTEALELIRKAESALVRQGAFEDSHDRLVCRVQLAEEAKQILATGW